MAVVAMVVAYENVLLRRHWILRLAGCQLQNGHEEQTFQDKVFYVCLHVM